MSDVCPIADVHDAAGQTVKEARVRALRGNGVVEDLFPSGGAFVLVQDGEGVIDCTSIREIERVQTERHDIMWLGSIQTQTAVGKLVKLKIEGTFIPAQMCVWNT